MPVCTPPPSLFNTLGYQSEKTLDLSGSPQAFLGQFDNNPDRAFRKDKALFDDWKEIHLLFQLTDQELSGQNSLFTENKVKQGLMSSYLFFALRLKGESYPRGKLAQITRQLNRLFPMPVMVMFEYNGKLSIAVINRRRSKRDADKDVLGKVTFIQDISLTSPHRGHLDILGSFSLPALAGRTGIHSFDALHTAWEEIFNVELLNRKFYRELSNWYFWAMQHVHFPFDGVELDKSELFRHDEKIREQIVTYLLKHWSDLESSSDFDGFVSDEEVELQEPGQPTDNLFCDGDLTIEVGTVHSVKGETHTATLYLETYYKKTGSQRLLSFLKGEYPQN